MAKNLTTGLQRGLRQSIAGGLGTGDLFSTASLDLQFARHKSLDSRVTHTRQSSATYVDGDGVIRTAVTNLLLRSEEFDNAAWNNALTPVAVTANTETAPNGSSTADTLANTANTSSEYRIFQSITASSQVALSVYVKKGTHQFIQFRTNSVTSGFVNFDLDGVTASATTATGQIVDAGNGWRRCTAVFAAASIANISIVLAENINAARGASWTPAGTISVYLWGAQLEESSTVGQYVKTTTAINSAPRFDHDPTTGESLGLLVEESRANNQRFSEDFSQGLTPTNASLTTNVETAPDGNQAADRFLETTANGLHSQEIADFLFVLGTTYTFSCFAKSIGGRTFCPGFPTRFGTARFGRFSLTGEGSVLSADDGVTASIQAYPNGWYRCSITSTCTQGGGARVGVFIGSGTSISYVGDATKGLYLWGAQLEAGSFPTSYIPTEGSTVTRAADVASITGTNFSSWYEQSEGTMFVDFQTITPQIDAGPVTANDGTNSNRVGFDITSTGFGRQVVDTGGSSQVLLGTGGLISGSSNKLAAVYKVNDFAISKNGGSVVVDTSGTIPTVNQLQIGSRISTFYLNTPIRRLTYWPTRLSNDTLQTITR